MARHGVGVAGDFLRGDDSDDIAAEVAGTGAYIDNGVGVLYNIPMDSIASELKPSVSKGCYSL